MKTPLILVVDDDPRYLELMEFALQTEGYRVAQTTEPRRVQALAVEERPDVIVMDVAMPEMDGYSVAMGLKADSLTAEIPLIFATARGMEPDKIDGWNVGAAEYLTKPFSVSDILACIQRTLQKTARES